MKTICLVSCVSKKREGSHAAEFLYDSPFFSKARAYAKSQADVWYILSAKHGLTSPTEKIEKYNVTLNQMGIREREVWASGVLRELEHIAQPGDRLVFLAGLRYREFLVSPLKRRAIRVEIPMEGKKIGEQLQWLGRFE